MRHLAICYCEHDKIISHFVMVDIYTIYSLVKLPNDTQLTAPQLGDPS